METSRDACASVMQHRLELHGSRTDKAGQACIGDRRPFSLDFMTRAAVRRCRRTAPGLKI